MVRNDILYEEAMQKIRGLKKDEEQPEAMGSRLISSSLMATGFGAATQPANGMQQDPSANNIRVKLPDKDDDDLSEADNDAEKEMEANERMKIKLEA